MQRDQQEELLITKEEGEEVQMQTLEELLSDSRSATSSEAGADTGTATAKSGKPAKKPWYRHYLVRFLVKILMIAAVICGLLKFVFGITINYGNQMYPAIKDGDLVITYKLEQLSSNDVVLYEHNGETRLGRIVGWPGYTIDITERSILLVDGAQPSEEIFYPTGIAEKNGIKLPYVVPEGSLFLLNDYRSETDDSREYGAIPLTSIHGKVMFVIRRRGF